MSVFLSSLGRFPRWILSFRSSTKPPRGRPDCCLSPEPIETNDEEEREERRENSKTKRVIPQSLVNSSHMREHKYILIVSRTKNIGERKSWITQTKDALISFSRVSCVSTTSHLSEPTPSPGWKTKGEPSWETRRTRPRSLLLIVCALKRVQVK